jgi:hypothetical protein
MGAKTYRPEHAKQVMEVAVNELELLLRQRLAITERVKAVKRTVKGLTTLFGEEAVGQPQLGHLDAQRPKRGPSEPLSPPSIVNSTYSESADQEVESSGRSYESGVPRGDFGAGGDVCPAKLERACRIALLESEKPATAGQIYDRITRRGSYQLSRYKHPLVRLIAALDMLVKEGEALTVVDGDCRCWQWRAQQTDAENEKPTFPSLQCRDDPAALLPSVNALTTENTEVTEGCGTLRNA